MKIRPILYLAAAMALLPLGVSAKILSGANAAKWKVGAPPPSPWQHSAKETDIKVEVVKLDGTNWIEFQDNSSSVSANIRQEFSPLRSGRLSLKVKLAADHGADFGIYLGPGNASSPAERVVDLKTNSRGMLRMGSTGERLDSGLVLARDKVEHIFVEFRAKGKDVHIRLGRIGADGKDEVLGEDTFPGRAQPVTRLRLTTDNSPQGAHFYVTDLQLSPLN
ncbi:MAG: hypothetical protein Q8M02_11750 [Candidatus Didemnitutus sp.]|nr:hypothetical protein [Candidatus Didemnitutus sp.]